MVNSHVIHSLLTGSKKAEREKMANKRDKFSLLKAPIIKEGKRSLRAVSFSDDALRWFSSFSETCGPPGDWDGYFVFGNVVRAAGLRG